MHAREFAYWNVLLSGAGNGLVEFGWLEICMCESVSAELFGCTKPALASWITFIELD